MEDRQADADNFDDEFDPFAKRPETLKPESEPVRPVNKDKNEVPVMFDDDFSLH